MSKGLHTPPAVLTRVTGRLWTSCSEKWLKYSVNSRAARGAGCGLLAGLSLTCLRQGDRQTAYVFPGARMACPASRKSETVPQLFLWLDAIGAG